MRTFYRIREYTRPSGYWVYVFIQDRDFTDYYTALAFAIYVEKRTGIKNWVELITED